MERGQIGRIEFLDRLRPYLSETELEDIEFIYNLAKCGHKGQFRDEGVRYFEHPKQVALILMDELGIYNFTAIAKALLHDIDEDSYVMSLNTIERHFGKEIAKGIKYLTRGKYFPKEQYLLKLFEEGHVEDIIVKYCDRLHNLKTLKFCEFEKQKRIIRETDEKYIPQLYSYIENARKTKDESLIRKLSCLYNKMQAFCIKYRDLLE